MEGYGFQPYRFSAPICLVTRRCPDWRNCPPVGKTAKGGAASVWAVSQKVGHPAELYFGNNTPRQTKSS